MDRLDVKTAAIAVDFNQKFLNNDKDDTLTNSNEDTLLKFPKMMTCILT